MLSGIEIKAIKIVKLLKLINTKKAIPHKNKAYPDASFVRKFYQMQ